MATKLYVPKLRRGLVARPRLLERLGRGAEARLTLVSAPAGFGKTTLLAEWLGETPGEDRSVAWLSLDPADNEPASFWTYVVTALQNAVPSVGSSALELLASSPLSIDRVLTTLLNELAASPSRVWLVLDDYHLVEDRDVRDGMAFLLEHLPPPVHVVLSTRADPDLPLARWRGRGELVEIRAADLRFTSDEAAVYLNAVTGLDLAAEDVAVLDERTEGWIAALQLAALSLQGREDAAGFIARFAGDDRYIVDYLMEEVLRHQPDAVRGFLLQSAVLDRLTGPLCDAVTGRDDGRDMLVALERANLFIVALDDRREWYRYHHLFADVLRARMRSEQPDQVSLLHQRASQWYERHDLTEEAVRHALAARDFDRAAHLMELAVPAIRRHRQEAMMHRWLKSLPDDAVRRSPVLSVFYGSMLMVSGDLDAVEPRLDDAERALAAVPDGEAHPWADTEELHTLPATIAIYRASLAQARGDGLRHRQTERHAQGDLRHHEDGEPVGLGDAAQGRPAAPAIHSGEHRDSLRPGQVGPAARRRRLQEGRRRDADQQGRIATEDRLLGAGRLHRLRGDGRRDHQQLQAARPGRQGDQVAAGLGRPAEKSGKFDMMINFVGSGCDYANGLGATLDSSQFPTTTSVKGNVERFSDPKVGAAVKALTGTTDKAAIKQQVGVLADTMMTQFPVMPILYAPARGIYRTDHAVGWPTEQDPYANPQDNFIAIMTHLVPPS